MFFKKTKQFGFTIIEIIVVLAIVSIGLIGVISLMGRNIQVERNNKNFLVASMLAQEGLELARNIRDTNWYSGTAWDNNLVLDNTYTIDYNSGPDATVNSINDPGARLYLNGGFYDHNSAGGILTPYARLITSTAGANYVTVVVSVQWMDAGRTQKYEATTLLYNWK
jgi:prepilin-type N-terminal cleavage/methylation domain-containing protein